MSEGRDSYKCMEGMEGMEGMGYEKRNFDGMLHTFPFRTPVVPMLCTPLPGR